MSNGRILKDGRKQDVLDSKALSQVFGMEVEVARRDGYYHFWGM
jgi:ABC-type enterochelin transport system ATPase subunit